MPLHVGVEIQIGLRRCGFWVVAPRLLFLEVV